jgi:hypothetical protein
MIQNHPYSIYVDNRPKRIAFLIDPKITSSEQIDAIIKFNQGKWGGRFNPIILADSITIEDNWWKFLRDYDPDVIKALIPIQDELIEKIDTFLSPYSVEVPKDSSDSRIYISDDGLSILPSAENIAKISQSFWRKSKMVVFDLTNLKDDLIKQFITRNFGTVDSSYGLQVLAEDEKLYLEINDIRSLASAFETLSTHEIFVYPIQLCSLPNSNKDVKYNRLGEAFTVVVGNSIEDIVYCWNKSLMIPRWRRTQMHHIWLPVELAKNDEINSALKKWLKRAADPGGTTNQEILFMSYSLEEAELKSIAEELTKAVFIRSTIEIKKEFENPHFDELPLLMYLKKTMDFYRAATDDEHIILNEPDVEEGFMKGQYWMSDVYIQFRPGRNKYIIGKESWWQLPPRNRLAHRIFQQTSRVNSDGIPSVLMRRGEPILSIRLPDDKNIFLTMIYERSNIYYTADPRSKLAHKTFDEVQLSDKGQYLSGFLDLFSDLYSAYQVLQERYWRRMFDLLSHKDPSKDEKKYKAVLNKINKEVQAHGPEFLSIQKGREWLAQYILQISKSQASTGKEIGCRVFYQEAQKELSEYNAGRPEGNHFHFNEEYEKDLRRDIHYLIEKNILLVGIRPRCNLCGLLNWYHIDEVRQSIKCKGCGNKFSLRPQEKWYYRLNSLVEVSCAQHGLIPVVLVLGQLFHDSRVSFMFTESLELYEKRDEEVFGDIDIVCVQDGKFIIGEIKQSTRLFSKSDFGKMTKIAEIIRPNKLLFSSLDREPTDFVLENIEAARKKLAPLEIDVQWYQLHSYIFEAAPI